MLPRGSIEGRVAAEPVLRFSQNGKAIASLRMVAADRRKNASGEWEDADTLWVDVTCFDKLAENVCESVAKGDLVLVHGKWRTEEWTDRDSGQQRSKIAFLADTVAASLQFRQIPHGGSRPAQQRTPAPATGDPWGSGEEPPF
jgi:single-strand DNA-binding protein